MARLSEPLLERDDEVAALGHLVEGAAGGDGALALIEGPAGIGKSRLLAEARTRAEADGFRVLAARGSELERELPFGVVRELLEPVLAEEREARLSGAAEPAARVFEPPQASGGDTAFGILHGLFWLVADLAADGPLLLAVDDLHWCDAASLRFVAYLGRRLEGLPVLLAATSRMREPTGDGLLLAEIAGDPACVSIRPGVLSADGAATLVRERLGQDADEAFCAASHRATGGNPLLLGELVKTLQAQRVPPDAAHVQAIRDLGPRAVSRTVLLRLARLPEPVAAVARAVAVAGDGATLPVTAAVAELGERDVAAAARALVAAEILRPEPPLAFVHPLVRDAVYHDVAPAGRELLHERAARALAELGAPAEQVAGHLLAVPPRASPWTAATLREAGLDAGRRGATESAVAHLRRAFAEPPPGDVREQVLLELGMAEAYVNASDTVEHLGAFADRLEDPRQRAAVVALLVRSMLHTEPPQRAADVARRALDALPEESGAHRAIEAFALQMIAFGAEIPGAAERLAAVRGDDGGGAGLGWAMLRAAAAWDWALRDGTADGCATLALAALADGRLLEVDPAHMALAAIEVLIVAGHDDAVPYAERAITMSRRQGTAFGVCGGHVWHGWAWLERGELAEAEPSLRQGLEDLGMLGLRNGAGMAYAGGLLARTLVGRGDLPGARSLLARTTQPAPGSDGEAVARRAEVELLLAEGAWEAALERADGYRSALRHDGNPSWAPWRSLKAQALQRLSRSDEAADLLESELADARRWGAAAPIGRALSALGALRQDEALLREAVAVTDGAVTQLEHARALAALGSALRRGRRPGEAREPLREALALADRCGTAPLADHVRTELYAAGGRPRREALTGPGSLTPSERRVAELAAAGQGNREIAQALYVTPKTVEVHLTSVYRKLGIARRSGLAEALDR